MIKHNWAYFQAEKKRESIKQAVKDGFKIQGVIIGLLITALLFWAMLVIFL